MEGIHMQQKRLKVIAASAILLLAMVFLVFSMTKKTSLRHFTPADLIVNASTVDKQNVQVDGVISEGSSWDADNVELTFAVREPEGSETVNVVYANLKPDNFVDGGSVFVEGKYNAAKNLIVATKLQTKCASKYEGAESATTESGSY
jgi:cytochrome c-type biogenesis protein CcmE